MEIRKSKRRCPQCSLPLSLESGKDLYPQYPSLHHMTFRLCWICGGIAVRVGKNKREPDDRTRNRENDET